MKSILKQPEARPKGGKEMPVTFEARVFHGLLEPLEQVDLPEGKKLKVTVTDETELQPENKMTNEELLDREYDEFFKLAGIMDSGIEDLAENHDKYLYNGKQ